MANSGSTGESAAPVFEEIATPRTVNIESDGASVGSPDPDQVAAPMPAASTMPSAAIKAPQASPKAEAVQPSQPELTSSPEPEPETETKPEKKQESEPALDSASEVEANPAAASEPLSLEHRVSDKVSRLFREVPEIGTKWRWYDIPYRALAWLLWGRARRLLPWRLRDRVLAGINFFSMFEQYARYKVAALDDPMENLIIPTGEEVTQGGIWVVEFFPPSHYTKLDEALRMNGWDKDRHASGHTDSNSEQLSRARRGQGSEWFRLGEVVKPTAKYATFGAKREELPEEFDLIDLTAVQIGRSLTAVVVFIRLSKSGQKALHRVWTKQHEPTLTWRGLRRPDIQGRLFAGFRAVQAERQRLHDVARAWVSMRCPGFFAETRVGQPVIDLLLFKNYDPTADLDNGAMRDPLRALGLDSTYPYSYVSTHVPSTVFMASDTLGPRSALLANCWGIVGQHDLTAAGNDRGGAGPRPHAAPTVAGIINAPVRAISLRLAVMAYIDEIRGHYAAAIDTAKNRHRRYGAKKLDRLRSELLTASLDLPAVARDTATLWGKSRSHWDSAELRAISAPGPEGLKLREFDLLKAFGKEREKGFQQLLQDDAVYREVLTTASTLGASAEASRLGQRALVTAVVSVVVAFITLLVANTGGDTILSAVLKWFKTVT